MARSKVGGKSGTEACLDDGRPTPSLREESHSVLSRIELRVRADPAAVDARCQRPFPPEVDALGVLAELGSPKVRTRLPRARSSSLEAARFPSAVGPRCIRLRRGRGVSSGGRSRYVFLMWPNESIELTTGDLAHAYADNPSPLLRPTPRELQSSLILTPPGGTGTRHQSQRIPFP